MFETVPLSNNEHNPVIVIMMRCPLAPTQEKRNGRPGEKWLYLLEINAFPVQFTPSVTASMAASRLHTKLQE